MGILGKVLGAGLGFVVGGPLGAVIGGALGHQYDRSQGRSAGPEQLYTTYDNPAAQQARAQSYATEDYQTLFMVSLISMAAKIAKADGYVAKAEIAVLDTFLKHDLHMTSSERKIASRIFNEAKDYHGDHTSFARQFYQLSASNPQLLSAMVHLLFKIAAADGKIDPIETGMIHQIAGIFQLRPEEYEQIRSFYVKASDHYYAILGCTPSSSDEEIKKAYRKLATEYHPDKIVSKGLPEDFIQFANQKLKEINQAYAHIKKERNL
jgi:DnaJ like chaperone protein